jgi:hypothetical protein
LLTEEQEAVGRKMERFERGSRVAGNTSTKRGELDLGKEERLFKEEPFSKR